MEQVKVKPEGLIDHVEALSETYVKLVVANAAQKGVVIAAGVINAILISLFTVFVLLFAAAGLAWWLGDILNNRAAGFFIVAGVSLFSTLNRIWLARTCSGAWNCWMFEL